MLYWFTPELNFGITFKCDDTDNAPFTKVVVQQRGYKCTSVIVSS